MHVANFFDEFIPKPVKHTLDGGYEVTIKTLTYGESQKISNETIDGIDSNGDPQINFEEANRAKLKKISASLVEPRMTIKQLEALGTEADDVIDQLYKLVDPKGYESIEKAKAEREAEEAKDPND